jgi:hypothetical protein
MVARGLTEKVKTQTSDLKIDVVHIPGDMICQLQVLDVVATKPLKD